MININSSNINGYFDIEVSSYTGNWYINLWHDNTTYMGEIGIRISDGRFSPWLDRILCIYHAELILSGLNKYGWKFLRKDKMLLILRP